MASLLVWVVGGLLAYRLAISVYRLYFHPLRKIPGPKLAAMTTAYQFYYEIIKQGTFIWHLEKLHEIYGSYWSSLFFSLLNSQKKNKTKNKERKAVATKIDLQE